MFEVESDADVDAGAVDDADASAVDVKHERTGLSDE